MQAKQHNPEFSAERAIAYLTEHDRLLSGMAKALWRFKDHEMHNSIRRSNFEQYVPQQDGHIGELGCPRVQPETPLERVHAVMLVILKRVDSIEISEPIPAPMIAPDGRINGLDELSLAGQIENQTSKG